MNAINNNKFVITSIQCYKRVARQYPAVRYGVNILLSLAILPFITFITAVASSLAAMVMIATAIVSAIQLAVMVVGGILLLPVLLIAVVTSGLIVLAISCIWQLFA